MKVFSYGNDEKPGDIDWILKPTLDVTGSDIIIVDDIINTGATAKFISTSLRLHDCNNVSVCALLSKMKNRKYSVFAPYLGFEVDNDPFLFGYGLELKGRERNRINIYAQ